MKKITTNGRSFGTAQSLSRQQLKNVMGGVTITTRPSLCCAHDSEAPGNESWCCGLTKAAAQAKAAKMNEGKWCCDSCAGHASVNCIS